MFSPEIGRNLLDRAWFFAVGTLTTPLLLLAFTSSARAQPACNPKGALADYGPISVKPEATEAIAGKPLNVSWYSASAEAPPPCGIPAYLVITADVPIRFSGSGFMAFTAEARKPYGLDLFSGAVQAYVPLYFGKITRDARLGIVPGSAGRLVIHWKGVMIDPASKKSLTIAGTEGSLTVNVAPGAPNITIRDPFFFGGKPKRSVISPEGKRRLDDYGDHFQILSVDNLEPIYESPGSSPSFSPTGHFLYFFRARASSEADATDLTIYDLESNAIVLDRTRDEGVGQSSIVSIRWGMSDSIVSLGFAKGATLETHLTLVNDRSPFVAGLGPNCCTAVAEDAAAHIDLDNLLLTYSAKNGSGFDGNIVEALSFPPEDLAARLFPEEAKLENGLSKQDKDDPGTQHQLADGRYAWDIKEALTSRVDAYLKQAGSPLGTSADTLTLKARSAFDEGGKPAALFRGASREPKGFKGTRGLDQLQQPSPAMTAALPSNSLRDDQFARRVEDLGLSLRPPAQRQYLEAPPNQKDAQQGQWLSQAIARTMPAAADLVDAAAICNPMLDADKSVEALKVSPYSAVNATYLSGDHFRIWLVTQGCSSSPSVSDFSLRLALLLQTDGGRPELIWLDRVKVGNDAISDSMSLDQAPFPAPRLEAELFDDRYLLIANGDDGTVLEYDLKSRTGAVLLGADNSFAAVARLYRTDRGTIIRLDRDGRVHFYSPEHKETFLSGRYVDDELVVHDQSGFYDGTDEGARYVYLSFPGLSSPVSLSQYRSTLRRPDMIRSLFGREKGAYPAVRLLPPPEIGLTLTPDAGDTGPAVTLDVSARSTRPLKSILLYMDGRLAMTLPVSGTSTVQHVRLSLDGPSRWITAMGIDSADTESAPVYVEIPALARSAVRPVVHLVAVGTDTYTDPGIPGLRAPARDARSFISLIRSSRLYTSFDVPPAIIDSSNLREALGARFRELRSTARPADTLVVFIAGHGLRDRGGKLYLATASTDLSNLAQTALPWEEIASALKAIPGRKIVFLDVCHAGAADDVSNDQVTSALIGASDGIVIFSASKGRQLSQETQAGGLFTRSVELALRRKETDLDGNGSVELSELYRVVKREVIERSNETQVPWVARNALVGPVPIF